MTTKALGLTACLWAFVSCSNSTNSAPPINRGALSSVTISAESTTIDVGVDEELSLIGNYAKGSALISTGVTWVSSNNDVATIDATGTVSGVSVGTTTITATASGLMGTLTITVQLPQIEDPPSPSASPSPSPSPSPNP